MKLSKIGTLLLVLVLPVLAVAQGSGSTSPRPSASRTPSAFSVTRSVTGTVAAINAEEGLIVVHDKNGNRLEFKVDNRTKFKADKKTELRGKRDISLCDFQTGQSIKVTYRAADWRATEVRLKRARKQEMKEKEMKERMSGS